MVRVVWVFGVPEEVVGRASTEQAIIGQAPHKIVFPFRRMRDMEDTDLVSNALFIRCFTNHIKIVALLVNKRTGINTISLHNYNHLQITFKNIHLKPRVR